MRRLALRPLAALAATTTLVLLSACSGGGETHEATPADDSGQQEISPEQWLADNCNPKVAKISNAGDSEAAYALLAGPASAPQETSTTDIDQIRVYTYDEAANTMTPVRALSPGETLCYDSTAETITAESAPNDQEMDFAQVRSSEFPDGAWIDDVPRPMTLDESGAQVNEQGGLKIEYLWTTESVSSEAIEGTTETIDVCEVKMCGG